MAYRFSGEDFFEDVILFILTFDREQAQHPLADHFALGVGEIIKKKRIPASDDAGQTLADDGIFGRLDDGLKTVIGHGRRHELQWRSTLFGRAPVLHAAESAGRGYAFT